MNKLFLALLLLLPLTTFAEEDGSSPIKKYKPVMCFPYNEVLMELSTKYKEKPIFNASNDGEGNLTSVILLKNEETGTWSLIEYKNDKPELACFLANGTEKKT